jgi:hypothetical protein
LRNFIWLIVLVVANLLNAQKLEFFGYFEPQLTSARLKGEYYLLSSNKLRVDLQSRLNEHVFFAANFNYITYHGKTEWDLLKFLPESVTNEASSIEINGNVYNPYILFYKDRNYLDNAYVKLSFFFFDFTAGKQQLSMGTGYVWNPTDVFNRKDITDPTYEQPGHNAFRLDVPIKNSTTFTSILAPTKEWKYVDVLLKFKHTISHFDISVVGIQKFWPYSDARVINPLANDFYKIDAKRHILGIDLVGELFGLGVWAEGAFNKVRVNNVVWQNYLDIVSTYPSTDSLSVLEPTEIKRDFYELTIGFDYTFDFLTYFMCEYFRNTYAKSSHLQYTFDDWMQYYLAETRSLARDQLYLLVQHPITDLIDVGLSTIVSVSDKSVAIVPTIVYNLFENVDVTFIGTVNVGKEGTAYGKDQGFGAILRAKVYF